MSDTQHTPGPWFKARYPGHKPGDWTGWHVGTDSGRSVGPPDVCTVDDVDFGPEEAEANARLIVAAPDLLAALRRIISAADAYPEPIHYKVRKAINDAREAISKTEAE